MLGKGCSGHRPIPSVCQHASEEGCPKHPMPPRTEETKRTEPQAPCPEFVNTPPKRVVSVQKETPAHAHDRVAAHMSCFSSCTPRAHPRRNALLCRLAAFLLHPGLFRPAVFPLPSGPRPSSRIWRSRWRPFRPSLRSSMPSSESSSSWEAPRRFPAAPRSKRTDAAAGRRLATSHRC